MKPFIALIALLFLVAADCGGHLVPPPPPEDSCFNGNFANAEFSLEMNHDSGQVWTTIIKPATSTSPWEGMSFIGKITETGTAVGVLRLNYPDNNELEIWDYGIYLEPSTGLCDRRNTLTFPRSLNGEFEYILTRQ